MGELIDGQWHRTGLDTILAGGAVRRKPSIFRNWVTRDGSIGFKAELGRYHLYVSLACPWAHRTLIMRNLKALDSMIGVSVVRPGDYYPLALREEIDAVNERVYANLNNGVYMAGFATKQSAYEEAVARVFATLDWLEARLSRQRYLVGARLTEADIRLFTTLVRFDAVYHGHFKCNRRMLIEYRALWDYTRDLYQHPAIRPTVNFEHIKAHYYQSHPWLNGPGIVPSGPERDFDAPLNRARSVTTRRYALAGKS
jgi:glutathionyl-hydroquinone reductase